MLLSLKLGSCVSFSDKKFEELLQRTCRRCNQAKNAAVREWYLDASAGQMLPEKFVWDKRYYHVARNAARSLNSNVASAAIKQVSEILRGRMPWDAKRAGSSKYKWQAILNSEISLPTFRSLVIPIPVSGYRIGWEGNVNRPDAKLRCKSECVLKLPLLSRESGYQVISPFVRLLVGDLGAAHKNILRRIVDPEDPLVCCDSLLSEADGKWFVRMSYKDKSKEKVKLKMEEGDRVVTLMPNRWKDRNPFKILYPAGGHRYTGFGEMYQLEHIRLEQRRSVLRFKYRHSQAGKGHGRGRYFAKQRPLTRGWECLVDRVEKQVIADVVSAVRSSKATGVIYREPTMPLRKWEWYGRHELPWSWSEFELKLRAKMNWEGIAYEKERIGCAEYRDYFAVQDMPEADEATEEAVLAIG